MPRGRKRVRDYSVDPLRKTHRALEIIKLVRQGFTSKQIGAKLGISPQTVDHILSTSYTPYERGPLGTRRVNYSDPLCNTPNAIKAANLAQQGLSNKQIAKQLGLKLSTVTNYLACSRGFISSKEQGKFYEAKKIYRGLSAESQEIFKKVFGDIADDLGVDRRKLVKRR
jgi:DNA-binding CsgD family transcriptional regulator